MDLFFEYPQNELCDVIFLTNTSNDDIFQMTQSAINSLNQSELKNFFRIIVVESNENAPKYDVDLLLQYTGDFNYNKALNLAFNNLKSDWVCVCNNDVKFLENWYSNIRYYMNIFNLDSASPWCPYRQFGLREDAQQMILKYPPCSVMVGYEAIMLLCGWCWIIKRNVLEKIRPFPETLSFWFQDNYLGFLLQKNGYKHGCVTASHVVHYGQKSYSIIPPDKMQSMTVGLQQEYLNLINI